MSPQTEKMARAPSPSKDKTFCSICLRKLSFCFTLDNFFFVTFFLVTFLNQVSSNNKSNFPVHCLLDPKGIPLPCSLFETQLQVNFIWFHPTDSVSNFYIDPLSKSPFYKPTEFLQVLYFTLPVYLNGYLPTLSCVKITPCNVLCISRLSLHSHRKPTSVQ